MNFRPLFDSLRTSLSDDYSLAEYLSILNRRIEEIKRAEINWYKAAALNFVRFHFFDLENNDITLLVDKTGQWFLDEILVCVADGWTPANPC